MWDVEQLPNEERTDFSRTNRYICAYTLQKNICTLFYKKIHIIQKF